MMVSDLWVRRRTGIRRLFIAVLLSVRPSADHATTATMRNITLPCAALTAAFTSIPNLQAQPIPFTLNGYDLVEVGDPGNAAQVSASPNQNGYGAVTSDFWIGKNEVTIGQYAEFLNAVAKSDPRSLYNTGMTNARISGIQRTGTNGAYVYAAVGPNGSNPVGAQSAANRPITFVSWFDSARFANWMANGKLTGAEGAASIDDGAYTLGTAISGTAPAKNSINPNTGAAPTFFLPTENQWYKAAYYSPVKDSGSSPGYFLYGTQSDSTPGNGWNGSSPLANKDLTNQMNYRASVGGAPNNRYAVTGTNTLSTTLNILTEVGAFTNTYSYYGAFDMSGNVEEWNDLDGFTNSSGRGLRGGNWGSYNTAAWSASRREIGANTESESIGFRLASPVPEPSTYVLVFLGAGAVYLWKRRKGAL